MKFDVLGRIENMDLPDGKTAVLYSVYEAVSNAIHAINDKFGEDEAAEKGRISVDIDLAKGGQVESITVIDNGVGFTETNIASFETSDSRYKYQRGGKGVGRLIWIKTFADISVQSRVSTPKGIKHLSFDFDPTVEASIVNKTVEASKKRETGSRIRIFNPRRAQGGRMNQATFMKDLALHFFPLYIAGTLPDVILTYNGEERSLKEFIGDKVDQPIKRSMSFDADGEVWTITVDHMFVDPTVSADLKSSYILTAHGRLVGEPVSVDARYALRELANGKAYVAVVSGEPLDERVDQQRLGFRFNNSQRTALEEAVLAEIEDFLVDHITVVRGKQRKTVESVLEEHPQLASQITDIDDYVAGLYPGMDDEQILQNLFVLLYREEKKLRKRVTEIAQFDQIGEPHREAIEQTLFELSEQERNRLAELVVKRHQVLQTAHLLLKHSDTQKQSYYYVKLVHDLVCPMGRMFKTGDFDDHNLWVLDESLSNYEFISSDKSIRSLVGSAGSRKEPDLVFFNPLGFRQAGVNSPITIVEFKRPGDALPSQNPVDQVLEYIEEFRGHNVRSVDGEVISDVTDTTPFNCFIVCELTEETRKLLLRSVAQTPTPDNEGYYGWSTAHNAVVQVMSFKKMLGDALMRNRAFFDALKLGNPSVAARARAAKRRAASTGRRPSKEASG